TVRSIRSLAVSDPNRFVSPSISSRIRAPCSSAAHDVWKGQAALPLPSRADVPERFGSLRLSRGLNRHRSVDDVLAKLVDLVLELLGDLTFQLRAVDQVGAAVLERSDIRLVVELPMDGVG